MMIVIPLKLLKSYELTFVPEAVIFKVIVPSVGTDEVGLIVIFPIGASLVKVIVSFPVSN